MESPRRTAQHDRRKPPARSLPGGNSTSAPVTTRNEVTRPLVEGERSLTVGGYGGPVIREVEVRDAGTKGRGVYARRHFLEGEFIFRRRHKRVVTEAEVSSLDEWGAIHLCELDFDRFAVLDPPGCFLNHSCDPNAMRHGVKVFAWRAIAKEEEITIDYRLNAFDGTSWPCACGSRSCTGTVVGSFFAMKPERQELLLPHAPSFIRREYRRRKRQG